MEFHRFFRGFHGFLWNQWILWIFYGIHGFFTHSIESINFSMDSIKSMESMDSMVSARWSALHFIHLNSLSSQTHIFLVYFFKHSVIWDLLSSSLPACWCRKLKNRAGKDKWGKRKKFRLKLRVELNMLFLCVRLVKKFMLSCCSIDSYSSSYSARFILSILNFQFHYQFIYNLRCRRLPLMPSSFRQTPDFVYAV